MIPPPPLQRDEPLVWSPGRGSHVWEMFVACAAGDLATVRGLMAGDPSLVRAHWEYRTPLSFAVRANRPEVAAFLLDNGADPLALGDPLEAARERGLDRMVALLEERLLALHGASARGEPVAAAVRQRDPARALALIDDDPTLLEAGDRRSNRPLHWAVMTRQLDLLDELLARGADIDARRDDGARPLQLTNGDYHYRGWRDVPPEVDTTPDQVYRHLLARGARTDLGMAAYKGDIETVRALLARDPSAANRPAEYNSYYPGCGAPLKNAAAGGHLEIVRLLLEHGADPNLPEEGIAPRGHALWSAAYGRHHEIARLLLEHGAFPNPPVESSADAVWIAIRNGDLPMVELLASYGATWEIPLELEREVGYEDVAATGIARSLPVLAFHGDVEAAERILADDPSLADDPEALEAAASRGHEAFVRLLLAHRADLATRVTVSRPRRVAELLFEQGMDPSRRDWLDVTPLHRFAERGDVESALLFIGRGADLDARDEELRSTPLGWAARAGRIRVVELLLRKGARSPHPDDPAWATPLAWARRRGHEGIVALLEEHARTGAVPAPALAHLEALVGDVLAAWRSGEEGALARVAELFAIERELARDQPPRGERVRRLRHHLRERLEEPAAGGEAGELTPEEARLLVARAHGFEDWARLVQSTI